MAPSKKTLQIGAIGFDQQAEKLSFLPKQQINRQDIFGRTLLHLAASTGNALLVDAILDNPHVDTNALDLENGWTALHRALAYGNISAARLLYNRDSAEIQDRSKATALDVLISTIEISLEKFNGKGTELFTFGSNANHTLGFADPDDRSHPAWVKLARPALPMLTPRYNFKPTKIAGAAISKLHSAVIVDGSLLTAGISRGGRLGTGAQSTQFEFTAVPIGDEAIVDVALGLDHSVAVTSGGAVYTWGSNKSAQLGYATDGLQIAPRKVLTSNEMRRADITRCSASRIHTIAFNTHEIYIWGTNIGQMGFISTPDASVGSVVVEGGGVTEPNPRLLTMSHEIVDAIATDTATIVLLDNGDVRVYMKGGSFRVALPEASSLRGEFDVFRSRAASIPIRVEMISASSLGTVSMLTNLGSILQFQLDRFASSEESVSQFGRQLRVNEVWKPRSKQMRARHVACADDGSIVVCVANGSVWKRRKTKRGTSVERLPLVNRIQRVVCDANFASFMAIREDLRLEPVAVTGPELADDLEFCLPFVNGGDSRKHDEMLRSEPSQGRYSNFYFEDSREFEDEDESDASNKVDPGLLQFVSSMSEESLAMRLENAYSGKESLIWKLKGISMPVNRWIFEARVPDFVDCDLAKMRNGSLQFDDSVRVETLVVLCYYLYADKVIPAWDASRLYARDKLEGAREQVLELASKWKLDRLRTSIIRMVPAAPSLSVLKLSNGHDVTIQLKDGKSKAHKFMLQTRSSFFESVFSSRWNNSDTDTLDLSHISKEVFDVVLMHIYRDTDNQSFDACNITNLKSFIRLVTDTMATADELSLLRLREVCESILCSLVTVKNCGDFLSEAVKSHARQLRDRMLYYIAHNLECILENNFLNDLDDDLMQLIDGYMKLAQQSSLELDDATFWRALNEPVYHNEMFSREVPVYGASVANNLLLRERKRRQSSFANERPELKDEKQKSVKDAEPGSSPVRASPPSKEKDAVKTPIKAASSSVNTAPVPLSPLNQLKATPVRTSPAASSTASTPAHVEPVKIGDLFRQSPTTSSEPSKPIVIATPKISQKERRKMRQQSFTSVTNNSPPPAQALISSSPSKSWGTPPKSAYDPNNSPFAALKQKKQQPHIPPEVTTLKDIIQQEQRTVQQKQVQAQRSLKEIQEEEEFEKWWAEEAAKYQTATNPPSKGEHNSSPRSGNSKGKRGGRGGGNNARHAPRGRRQSGSAPPHAEAQKI